MTIIRRIYAYLLAGAGLALWTIALAHLSQLLIDVALQVGPATSASYVRDTAALYGALALVGLPVWLLHWRWIQRTTRAEPEERTSTLRRLYLYAVLAGAMLAAASALQVLLTTLLDPLFDPRGAESALNAVRHLPFLLIGAGVWLGHWRVAARDRDAVGEVDGSATLRRWYLYGLALIGLIVLLVGAQSMLEALWLMVLRAGPPAPAGVVRPAVLSVVGLGLWLLHWLILPERLPAAARGDDGTARLRSVYLFLGLGIGVVGTLFGASQLLFYAVGRALGVGDPGGVGGDLLQAAARPVSIGVVYGAAWAYQRRAVRRQAALFAEGPQQVGVRRLYTYTVALLSLIVLAVGAAGLLWAAGDLLLGPAATMGTSAWRERVALFATMAVVGLPVWILHWRPTAADADEARAQSRRLYVYLSLIFGALTLVGSAAAVLYKLIGVALGARFGTDVAVDLAHALAVAIVAGGVVGYHWRVLRADARLGAATVGAAPATAGQAGAAMDQAGAPLAGAGVMGPADVPLVRATAAPETVGAGARHTGPAAPTAALVEIRAADADALVHALAALRATGVQVEVR